MLGLDNCKGAFRTMIKKGNIDFVSEEEFKRRISFCEICPKSKGEGEQLKCIECGCCMDAKAKSKTHILHKAGKEDIVCPLGYWKYNFEEFKNDIDNGII